MPAALVDLLFACFTLAFSVYHEVRVDNVPATSQMLEGRNLGLTATDNDGVPHVYLVDWATLPASDTRAGLSSPDITFVHEMLHVADRADNGMYDGSLEPGGCRTIPRDCAHSWVYWALANPGAARNILDRSH